MSIDRRESDTSAAKILGLRRKQIEVNLGHFTYAQPREPFIKTLPDGSRTQDADSYLRDVSNSENKLSPHPAERRPK